MKGEPQTRRIPVYVVLPPQTLLLDVAGPLEVLRRANCLQRAVRFEVHYVGPEPSLLSSVGLMLTGIKPLPPVIPAGAMVLLAGNVNEVMTVEHQVQRPADGDGEAAVVDWLRRVIRRGHQLVSICSGALLAARAGLLDGYACTTHHGSCAELAALAPKAKVLENRLYVEDRERLTSAGVTAGIDLMLYVVSQIIDHGCAIAIARYLVVYLRRSGADPQLSPWLEGRNHLHPAVHRVQDAITANPTKAWTTGTLAKIAFTSSRHLSRLFSEHVGMSVTDYRNRLRLAVARDLVVDSRLDMERVAERAGFASTRQLRRVWRKFYPAPPSKTRNAL